MADTDPEDEIRNVESPPNAIVQTPYTDSVGDEISDHCHQVQQPGKRDREANPPALAGPPLKRPDDVICNLMQGGFPIHPLWGWKILNSGGSSVGYGAVTHWIFKARYYGPS